MIKRIYQFLPLIAKFSFLIALSSNLLAKQSADNIFDDWVPAGLCSQHSSILCDGCYDPLVLPNKHDDSPIEISSDTVNFSKGISVFKGHVLAEQGKRAIHADAATVKYNSAKELEEIRVVGNVKLLQPGIRVDGSKAIAYIQQSREEIINPVYRIYAKHARGQAKSATFTNGNTLTLKDATYTTCAPSSNAWYLAASTTVLNKQTGRGEAWNAALYAKDVPIFYFPYVNFPIDKRRQSGLLQPEFENSSLNGKTLVVPYYWNIAPNYDATITTNYMSSRGFKFDSIFRFLTKNSHGAVDFDFLPNDRAYRALRNSLYADPTFMNSTDSETIVRRNDVGSSNFRYRIAVKDVTYINPCWLFALDFTDASDGNYLYDFQPDSPSYINDKNSSLYALQRASLQNFNRLGTFRALVERHQTFHVINGPSGTEQLTKLPTLDFNSAVFPLYQGFETYVRASFTNFRSNVIPDSGMNLTYGQRTHIRPVLAYPIVKPGWFVIPRAQVNYVQYDHLHVSPVDAANGIQDGHTSIAIPMFDVKTGIILERNTKIRNTPVLQTLEPQIYYLYVPKRNQNHIPNLDSGLLTFDYNQLFRDNRYTGGDFIGDANQLSFGIATKFYHAYTGAEQGFLGLGKIKYFRNVVLLLDQELDKTDKHWSPWALVAKFHINSDFNLEGNMVTTTRSVEIASLQMQYKPNKRNVLNISYEYLKDAQPDDLTGLLNSNLDQVGMSFAWQVTSPLRLLGKLSYDLRFHRYLDSLAGFEYHTCCTALRFVWSREWLSEIADERSHNNIFRLQFIFKGFGSIGNATNRYIASLIPGYQPLSFD